MALEQVWWIDADGGQINLNDWGNYACTRDRAGVWSPPFTLTTTRMPLAEGGQLQGVVVEQRGVDFTQMIRAASHDALVALIGDLAYRMDPTRGIGTLKLINGNGTRVLNCYAEGIKDLKDNLTSATLTLSFLALDPYWYAAVPTTVTITNSGPITTFFSSQFLPLNLISSTVYSLQTINNPGNAQTYPIWTINGPGDTIILKNLTSGKFVSLGSLVLTLGQQLIIDAGTNQKTVAIAGASYFNWVSKASSLWPLIRGNNQIQIQMSNTTLASSLQLQFTPRYE